MKSEADAALADLTERVVASMRAGPPGGGADSDSGEPTEGERSLAGDCLRVLEAARERRLHPSAETFALAAVGDPRAQERVTLAVDLALHELASRGEGVGAALEAMRYACELVGFDEERGEAQVARMDPADMQWKVTRIWGEGGRLAPGTRDLLRRAARVTAYANWARLERGEKCHPAPGGVSPEAWRSLEGVYCARPTGQALADNFRDVVADLLAWKAEACR